MIAEQFVFFLAIVFLVTIAITISFANRNSNSPALVMLRPGIYALASALFSMTIFTYRLYDVILIDGWSVLAFFIGILLIVGVGLPFIKRIAKIIRIQHIKTLPDFLATRYGKKYSISVIVTVILLFIALPFLGVQIWYLDYSTDLIVRYIDLNYVHEHGRIDVINSVAPAREYFKPITIIFIIFIALAALRSTSSRNGTDGIFFACAIAAISIVSIIVIYFVYFAYFQFDGVGDLTNQFSRLADDGLIEREFSPLHLILMLIFVAFTYVTSPWQFQILFADNNHDRELTSLRNIFLPVFSIFFGAVLLSSLGAIILLNGSEYKFSLITAAFVAHSDILGILLYMATAVATTLMIIIEILAIARIIGNDLIMPILIKNIGRETLAHKTALKSLSLLNKILIILTLMIGYGFFIYYPYMNYDANIVFAANILLFQLTPALIGGVYWRRATYKGVISGIIVGFMVWGVSVLLPILVQRGMVPSEFIEQGLFGLTWLRPASLFGFDVEPNSYGAIISTMANVLVFVGISLIVKPTPEEIVQNDLFSNIKDDLENSSLQTWQRSTSLFDLQELVGQYIGQDVAAQRFRDYAKLQSINYELNEFASVQFVEFAKQQLTANIGASSARFVMALIMERKIASVESNIKLLDEASEFIQHNREILQSAIDNINQGICVLDENLKLTFWNKAFLAILNIPDDILQNNVSFEVILEYCAKRGDYGQGEISEIIAERILNYVVLKKTVHENITETKKIIEVTSSSMPEGGCVITFNNVTDQVLAANELESANVNLELRVSQRTGELTTLNKQLVKAKASADEANIDKTRFLAAASHDISQPMNAARLYSTALLEQTLEGDAAKIAQNLDLSLTSVEEILVALLDISRLDSGVFKAEISHFELNDLFEQLYIEFKPLAEKKDLKFRFVATQAFVKSDRRHLRRIIQNYISNAIKYTEKGSVLFGARRIGNQLRLDTYDTGHGVAPFQIKTIFKEFKRLESGMRVAQGVGLGLSIVDRISKMIGSKLEVVSEVDNGSRFSCFVDLGIRPEKPLTPRSSIVTARNSLANLNVICIDNEVEILNALEVLLGGWGINGIYTETSKDALQQIEERGIVPDAIIADYHLNFENGVFAIEKIRWQIDKPITAVLATADRSEQVAKVCHNKDIILMYKPLKPAILRAILARIDVDEHSKQLSKTSD